MDTKEFIVIMLILSTLFIITLILEHSLCNKNNEDDEDMREEYTEPKIIKLSSEQIEDIHSRGKITPDEKVKEWEGLGLCAPGDAIGSAAWRCKKFKDCHECLLDYAYKNYEHNSVYEEMKVVNSTIGKE